MRRRRGFQALVAGLVAALAGCYSEHPASAYVPKTYAQELNNKAVDSLHAGNLDVALAQASEALENDPGFQQAAINKANILARLGRFKDGADVLDTLVARDPTLAQAWLFLGIFREKAGDRNGAMTAYAEAIRQFDAAAARTPPDPKVALNRIFAVYLLHGKPQGLSEVNGLLQRYPGYAPASFVRERLVDSDRDFFLRWIANPESKAVNDPVQGTKRK